MAVFFLLNILLDLIAPKYLYAITGHNSMPEYRSFEPVATTNMVNTFDGSFTYNIPLLNVPNGYPITLSYHSNDVNTEAQASWVGLGWTLNPGAINRVKRGFPDEFNGQTVKYHSKMPKNWTLTAGAGASFELFSKGSDEKKGGLGLSAGMNIRYNNYQGFGRSISAGASLAGMASLNFSYSNGRVGFSPEINPGAILSKVVKSVSGKKSKSTSNRVPSAEELEEMAGTFNSTEQVNKFDQALVSSVMENLKGSGKPQVSFLASAGGFTSSNLSNFSVSSNSPTPMPVSVNPYNGKGIELKIEVGVNFLPIPMDPEGNINGTYTQQEYDSSINRKVVGYMNSEVALDGNKKDWMMDYFTENDQMYDKKDKFLPVPYPNNDLFIVSGEALGGSFRPYRSEIGTYRKNSAKSETFTVRAGADVGLASIATLAGTSNIVYSLGANIGGAYHMLESGAWDHPEINKYRFFPDAQYVANSNEKFILRFSGDKSSSFDQSVSDSPVRGKLTGKVLEADIDFGSRLGNQKITDRNLRSSYVEIHKQSDFAKAGHFEQRNLKLFKNNDFQVYDRSSRMSDNPNALGEVVTYNAEGFKYVYGLPINVRNEQELQYSFIKGDDMTLEPINGLTATINNASNVISNAERILGYESKSSYASQFLITQITSPDYIDRTLNGPTPDDFGSYTKFNYSKVAGGSSGWYGYRHPYDKVNYSYGSLSSNKDDMVSFNYGEKEIYFLHSIASRTHVAFFTTEDRDDGGGVKLNNSPSSSDVLKGSSSTGVSVKLKKLTKIDLYAIDDCVSDGEGNFKFPNTGARPIKTVRFKYAETNTSNELCKGIPNNSKSGGGGKLTLEKVWFEYGGINNYGKISPYVFHYQYPSEAYPAEYNALKMSNAPASNPNYDLLATDRWGNYRDYADLKNTVGQDLAKFWPYVNQKPSSTFDPAAWCLKKIDLPSGGQIHVQYEQHDYLYVQDKRAMVMVPLSTDTDNENEGDTKKKYFVDLAKVGIQNPTMELAKQMFEAMKGDRMYFNFLYRLIGDGGSAHYNTLNAEYIEGFARVSGYGLQNGKIYFVFKDTKASGNYKAIDNGGFTKRELPCKVCEEFYLTQRQGMVSNDNNAVGDDNQSDESRVKALLNMAFQITGTTPKCKVINPAMSYVRLPLPLSSKGKLGGGIRVKRLMMYESGMLSGASVPSLYGMEYNYTTEMEENGFKYIVSSGVATNEPGIGRRESPLVQPLPRNSQSKFEAILYGQDMYDSEGPLGESLLPAPSVGYSKVTIKNIHKGTTGTGYEEHEFYTCKDYPFKVLYTDIERACELPIKGGGGVGAVSADYSRIAPHLSQGYSFIQNEMHGKQKRIGKYAEGSRTALAEEIYEYVQDITRKGNIILGSKTLTGLNSIEDLKPGMQIYGPGISAGTTIESISGNDILLSNVTHYTTDDWFTFKVGVDVMDENMLVHKNQFPGKEGEVLAESRNIYDLTIGGSIGADVSSGALITYPAPTPFPVPMVFIKNVKFNASFSENLLRSHVVNKIIKYPAMVKRVTNISDGIRQVTENLVYDKYTGNPVVVRAYDDFNQDVLKQDFMASWNYKNMRSKSLNEGLSFTGTFTSPGYLAVDNRSGSCGVLNNFVEGDLLELTQGTSISLYHVDKVDFANNRLVLLPSGESAKSGLNGTSTIVILRSGYTNQLAAKAGMIQSNNKKEFVTNTNLGTPKQATTEINQFVALLNSNLPASGSKTINRNAIPANLKIIDPQNGNCINGNQIRWHIDIIKGLNGFELKIIGDDLVEVKVKDGTPELPHPFVNVLNNFSNQIWGINISSSIPYNNDFQDPVTHPIYPFRFYPSSSTPFSAQNLFDDLLQDFNNPSSVFNNINGYDIIKLGDKIGFRTSPYNTHSAYNFSGDNWIVNGFRNLNFYGPNTHGFFHCSAWDGKLNLYIDLFDLSQEAYTSTNSIIDIKPLLTGQFTSKIGEFGQNEDAHLIFKPKNLVTGQPTGDEYPAFGIKFFHYEYHYPTLCNANLPASSGSFSYNPSTNYIEFTGNGCTIPVGCLKICPEAGTPGTYDNVISASAATYSDDWVYDEGRFTLTSTPYSGTLNAYEKGFKGKWRPKDSYTYRKTVSHDRNFNTGRFTMELFNWANPEWNSTQWVKVNTIDQYGPAGVPLQEHNLMNIYSAAKYGYNNSVPVLVAQNADMGSVAFESFERIYNTSYLEDGLTLSNDYLSKRTSSYAHSGQYSMALGTGKLWVANLKLTQNKPLVVRAWVRGNGSVHDLQNALQCTYSTSNGQSDLGGKMQYVSSSGSWHLFEYIQSGFGTPRLNTNLGVSIQKDAGYLGNIWIDDIRVQPLESEMVCYVYDNALRLTSVLDDQHYALIYQYNPEGLLVRKQKETREGIKTLSETQYNTVKVAKGN
jgi:hypothetical protein